MAPTWMVPIDRCFMTPSLPGPVPATRVSTATPGPAACRGNVNSVLTIDSAIVDATSATCVVENRDFFGFSGVRGGGGGAGMGIGYGV